MRCVFRDCSEPVFRDSYKCAFHKNRHVCSVMDCDNQVYARKLCVKHGARKRCSFPKCHAFTQGHTVCPKHQFWLTSRSDAHSTCAGTSYTRELGLENLDALVFECTPQWIDAIDLAWLEPI
ncbi:hypothetical protein SPRG_05575 [Saprolegnia parasitica CBS 223.65]|uniref:Uncharacterized protein n=1 Tax=Saprolegnia parasitica (strain CBS 223.65) TaxID=695850 RepID=A0A067CS56_SAPPC|nr:hypothetical protein SPRG_05575 [Saprolegnia parasitica CBS 223.65]KDO29622.1 hypothetical protein SPRG_05575 [Saprolegnia parasitica CBS 223.65]|eukprot:XP_012199682.1 hypothetical protein SPRG_05575 [Saprolegnia parasitica CBS 223.65]